MDKVSFNPVEAEVGASIAFEFKGIVGLQSANANDRGAKIESNRLNLALRAWLDNSHSTKGCQLDNIGLLIDIVNFALLSFVRLDHFATCPGGGGGGGVQIKIKDQLIPAEAEIGAKLVIISAFQAT